MGFTEPDTPPSEPAQMPQASMPGIAPVPYRGPDESPEPPVYGPPDVTWNLPAQDVLAGAQGGLLQESGYAHDTGAGLVAPYYPGQVSPVTMPGNPGAAGDIASGSVAGAVSNATGRYLKHEAETHPAGSSLGDLLGVPVETAGNFGGAFYDPPRDYGAH